MRILIADADPPKSKILGWLCSNSLKDLGHDVHTINYRKNIAPKNLLEIPFKKIKPDIFFTIKGEIFDKKFLDKMNSLGVKTANWFPDDPHWFWMSKKLSKYYNYFFSNSAVSAKLQRDGGANSKFLPFACYPNLHKTVKLKKSEQSKYGCDVSFVGTQYSSRAEVMTKLASKYEVKIWGNEWHKIKELSKNVQATATYGEDMVKIFNASKIVFNIHQNFELSHGVNMRLFEATGCGSFLLTDWKNEMKDLFVPGKELVTYKKINEIPEIVQYYLENEKERKKIAKNGQKRTQRDHTYHKRMKEMLSHIEA